MQCVYDAFRQHICWLGLVPKPLSYPVYVGVKTLAQGTVNTYTHQAVVPYIMQLLARINGLTVVMIHSPFTKEYLSGLPEMKASASLRRIFNRVSWPEGTVPLLGVGIWLSVSSKHAYFSTTGALPGDDVRTCIRFQSQEEELSVKRSSSYASGALW